MAFDPAPVFAIPLGPFEIAMIVGVVVLLFGSAQIPKLARSLGQASKEFKDGQGEEDGANTKPADKSAGEATVESKERMNGE